MPPFLAQLAGNMADGARHGITTAIGVARTLLGLVFNVANGMVRGLLAITGVITGAVLGGLTAFAGAIGTAARAAMDYSRAIIDLRNSTGMSTSAAQGMASRFGAFGIKPNELGNGGQFFGITQMIGRVFGVNPSDPSSINRRAQSFGGGFMGFAMRNAMLGGIGMNNPNGQFLANLQPAKVQEQLGFQSQIHSTLGIGPETIRRYAEDFPLVIARLGMLRDAILMKLAETALPVLQKAVVWVADTIAQRGPQIATAIMGAIEWLWATAPHLAIDGATAIVEALQFLSRGFFTMAHTVVNFLRILEDGDSGFSRFVGGILQTIDFLSVAFRGFVQVMAPLGAMIYDFISVLSELSAFLQNLVLSLIKIPVNIAAKIGEEVLNRIPGMQGWATNLKEINAAFQGYKVPTLGSMTGERFINPVTAFQQASAIPTSDLYGQFQNFQNSGNLTRMADNADATLNQGEQYANDRLSGALGFLSELKGRIGSEDARRADFQAMIGELKKANSTLEANERNTRATSDKMGTFTSKTIDRVLSYVIEDAYLANAGG